MYLEVKNIMANTKLTEQDIQLTLHDFEVFCHYLDEHRPKLTKARQELGKKDCYALNMLFSRPRELDGPNYLQPSYPTINLFFFLATTAGLYKSDYSKGNSLLLAPSPRLEKYRSLSPFDKYMFLFKTYWTKVDFGELYFDSMSMFHHFMYTKLAFEALAGAEPGVRIFADVEDFNEGYDRFNPIHKLFVGAGLVVHHLSVFGFWEYEEAYIPDLHTTKKDIHVKAITPTSLGIAMINGCRKRPYEVFNEARDEYRVDLNWNDKQIMALVEKMGVKRPRATRKKEPFVQAFARFFPEGAFDVNAIENVTAAGEKPGTAAEGNVYIFKVSLNGKTWRKIKIAAAQTLHHLHLAIQDAFAFADDHLYAFFMDGKPWSRNAYWDKNEGTQPSADKAVLKKLGLEEGARFAYLFDFGDEWLFTVQLEEILMAPAPPLKPVVFEKKGKNPEQYPDWDEDFE